MKSGGSLILEEARRLYELGFAVHWIKPNSKAPVKPGWSSPVRDDWENVKKSFRPGFGLGVRLGESSNLGDGFLANIDVDIKSSDPRHQKEALDFLESKFPGLRRKAPLVKSSYGLRLFVKTAKPLRSGKLFQSKEECVVFMPTSEINQRQQKAVEQGKLSAKKLQEGYRVRPAWEVEFMSVGKQVVLPPSIHPDTKKPYVWEEPVTACGEIPTIELYGMERAREPGRQVGSQTLSGFEPVIVDLVSSKLSDRIVEMILSGEGVEDRSAACFSVTLAMLRAGFTEQEVLSVLTDRETYLGETAFDHRKTNSRASAAAWVRDYCLRKAKEEISAARAFESEVGVTPLLNEEEAWDQEVELTQGGDWRLTLTRTGAKGDGPPRASLDNTLIVLRNAVSAEVFKRDLFALRDFYGTDAPWTGAKKGKALDDDDAVNIKAWIAENYRFEPNLGIVYEAMVAIATANGFHPVRDRLNALPAWDGVNRLDTWLAKNFGAKGNPEYLAQVFRKWMLAAVWRVFEPGKKFDWMILFQGKQGTGKSSFGSILFGQKYFSDWLPDLADKDAALGLQGTHCVEFGELDSFRKNEMETVKAFVTRQVDKVRPPYGRRTIESYRQCVFFGTTNRDEYLKDDTGNRRFNPIMVGTLDFDALVRDRDQLWAEALFIYRNQLESSLYLDGQAEEFAKEIQAEKMVRDEASLMVEEILKAYEKRKQTGSNPDNFSTQFNWSRFTMMELFQGGGPLNGWRCDGRLIQMAARAIKSIGVINWTSSGRRYYKMPESSRVPPYFSPPPPPQQKHQKRRDNPLLGTEE